MQFTKQFTHAGITFQIIVDLQTRRTIIENKIVSFNNIQISDIPYGRFNFYSEVSDFDTKKTILDYEEKAREYADRQSGDVDLSKILMQLGFSGTGQIAPPKSTNISGFTPQEQMATPAQINVLNDEASKTTINSLMSEFSKNPFSTPTDNPPTFDNNATNTTANPLKEE